MKLRVCCILSMSAKYSSSLRNDSFKNPISQNEKRGLIFQKNALIIK
jgi:hypothetical protein